MTKSYAIRCKCGQAMTVEEKHVGRTGKCSRCGAPVRVNRNQLIALDGIESKRGMQPAARHTYEAKPGATQPVDSASTTARETNEDVESTTLATPNPNDTAAQATTYIENAQAPDATQVVEESSEASIASSSPTDATVLAEPVVSAASPERDVPP